MLISYFTNLMVSSYILTMIFITSITSMLSMRKFYIYYKPTYDALNKHIYVYYQKWECSNYEEFMGVQKVIDTSSYHYKLPTNLTKSWLPWGYNIPPGWGSRRWEYLEDDIWITKQGRVKLIGGLIFNDYGGRHTIDLLTYFDPYTMYYYYKFRRWAIKNAGVDTKVVKRQEIINKLI